MKNFYIADWHYNHANCLHFDNRPFKTVTEMNDQLIKNWNSVVGANDTCYVLGDMFWQMSKQTTREVLDDLNGTKILVKGNHDSPKNIDFKDFAAVQDYLEIYDNSRFVVLSHYPIPCFKNHYYGAYHLYGHVHTSFEYNMMLHDKYLMEELYTKPCQMYNVGAMLPYMNYTPRTLDEILESANKPQGKEAND